MPLNTMTIKSSLRNYTVEFVADEPGFLQQLNKIPNHHFFVDRNVWNAHGNGILSWLKGLNYSLFETSEEKKTLESVQELYDILLELKAKKNLTLISIGGGIVQDISGFTADTLYRGINWIFIPTTLLAQADSCIGAKTSLNYKQYKNILGTFYTPDSIFICSSFLATLSKNDFLSGVGEIAKLFMISGIHDVKLLMENYDKLLALDTDMVLTLVQKALSIKKHYIEEDEFDTGKRNMLNFGHCFGHGIESATKYQIPHGQAVTIGIILANIVSRNRGMLSEKKTAFYNNEFLVPLLSVEVTAFSKYKDEIIKAMKYDKKRVGNGLPLIVIDDDGKMQKLLDLKVQEAELAIEELGMSLK